MFIIGNMSITLVRLINIKMKFQLNKAKISLIRFIGFQDLRYSKGE